MTFWPMNYKTVLLMEDIFRNKTTFFVTAGHKVLCVYFSQKSVYIKAAAIVQFGAYYIMVLHNSCTCLHCVVYLYIWFW